MHHSLYSLRAFLFASMILGVFFPLSQSARASELGPKAERAARWYVEQVCPAPQASRGLTPLPSVVLEQGESLARIARVLLPEAEWRDRTFGDEESRARLGGWLVTAQLQDLQRKTQQPSSASHKSSSHTAFATDEARELSEPLAGWFEGVVVGIDRQTLQRAFRDIESHRPPASWNSERSHCLRENLLAQMDGVGLQLPAKKLPELLRASEGPCLGRFPNP